MKQFYKNNRDKIKFYLKERINFVLNCKLSNETERKNENGISTLKISPHIPSFR